MVGRSVQVKEDIVEQDPKEHGIRKALNLGHTIGHAFESLALAENRPVLHGYAVAWGLVCELYLSYLKAGFPKDKMRQTIQFIKENYGAFAFSCRQYDSLYELMLHDKKTLPTSSIHATERGRRYLPEPDGGQRNDFRGVRLLPGMYGGINPSLSQEVHILLLCFVQ